MIRGVSSVLVGAVVAVIPVVAGCGSSASITTPLDELPQEAVSTWDTVDVLRFPPPGSSAPARRIFSVRLPPGWTVDDARMGADSWAGAFIGDGVRLSFQGGPFAVSEVYDIVGNGPVESDKEMAAKHVVTQETIGGLPAQLVRPRDKADGFTGMILDMPTTKLLVTGKELSGEEQAVAFAIFRSIRP